MASVRQTPSQVQPGSFASGAACADAGTSGSHERQVCPALLSGPKDRQKAQYHCREDAGRWQSLAGDCQSQQAEQGQSVSPR